MGKLIAIKEANKTRYVTQEVYDRLKKQNHDRKTTAGDITCSGAKSVSMGFTDEQYARIFHKVDSES